MRKITFLESLSLLISFFCAVNFGFGQIVAWEMHGYAGNEVTVDATINEANLNTSVLSRGSGLNAPGFSPDNTFATTNYTNNGTQIDAFANNDYLEFQISTISGYQVSLSTLDANFRRSNTGPKVFIWRFSTDGVNFTDIETAIPFTSLVEIGVSQAQIDLSTITVLQNVSSGTTITFRLYGWDSSAATGTFSIGRLPGNDLSLGGTVSAIPCSSTSTWFAGTWDNGLPTYGVEAIINDDYNTIYSGNQTSFSACSLTVGNNAVLDVADNTFVEVQNNITVDSGSSFIVQPYGTVVQINNLGVVSNNGSMRVIKKTSPMAVALEYTYWSSPVFNETIGNGLSDSDASRRYSFNAMNFLDKTKESGNNNATILGQDDIDDNGDDWQWVSGSTIMKPGVGYASTHDPAIFIGPRQYDYSFEGRFNNGKISVPIFKNDSETKDYNWNFIGNPYPSAIDADLFLAANSNISDEVKAKGEIDGAIFLWSQNTPLSAIANGNQAQNLSNDDYAIINAMGQISGGDGIKPTRFIPSGQGFFVSMSNTASATLVSGFTDVSAANVVFNNSMRAKGLMDNSQFFKNTNSKKKTSSVGNKLWLDLTSDNGVFNQILIGYVNGATNGDDGIGYDTYKSATKGVALYSTIENSNKKFAIQGKDVNSLDENEIIKLGFKTSVGVATLYKLSVAQLEGDFLSSHTIFLKDNLLNKMHYLSTSDYTFTSAAGEFNNRFEIAFSNQALAVEDVLLDKNTLKIVALENDEVQFTVTNDLKIKTVVIFDLLGRQLYKFESNSNQENYKLSNLNAAVYIAKVTLSNGGVITKKAFKK